MNSVTTNDRTGFRLAVHEYAQQLREDNAARRVAEPYGGCVLCVVGKPRPRKDGRPYRICASCHRLNRQSLDRRRAAELRMQPLCDWACAA